MTALLYILVAVASAALSTRAWNTDRDNPASFAFLGLGWVMALTYGSFALSLVPGLTGLRLVYMGAATLLPAFALFNVDRLFQRPDQPTGHAVARVFAMTLLVMPLTVGTQALLWWDTPGASWAQLSSGLFATVVLVYTLWRLWEVHESTLLQVDKVRLRYLIGVATGAVVFTLAEQLARVFDPPAVTTGLSLSARVVELQGAVPPFGAILALLSIYLLHHTLVSSRLLDLYEMISRLAALVATALALVLVDGLTVMWVDTFTEYPLHSTFQVFLASMLFLAAYDPLHDQINWWSNRMLNRRGFQLAEALYGLRAEIPAIISKDALVDTLLTRLHASGRVPGCSVYLWNQALDAYVLESARGDFGREPLAAVAAHPFTDRLADGWRWYIKDDLERRRSDAEAVELVTLLEAMGAELTVPIRSGDLILGWLHLTDEDWSDGFSAEEMNRLEDVASMASVVLSNIQDFQAMEEEHRLASLGAMAAGLAHEIRNPLAGIKGAAQYLQAVELEEDEAEMLGVVIHETDRLNGVVTQFLEYARPFKLKPSVDHVNAVASHVLTLVRAQGIPEGIELVEELAPDLPPVQLDRHRLSQVLINLCQNSLQAMPDGGTLTLRTQGILSRHGQSYAEIAVTDTGQGMDSHTMDNLFVPFFTTKDDGTGLGLAISRRIVRAHGGELDVQSFPGHGATFAVRIPMPPEPEEDDVETEIAPFPTA